MINTAVAATRAPAAIAVAHRDARCRPKSAEIADPMPKAPEMLNKTVPTTAE